ncbi:MAG: YdeI/OmpD-associated family protein [Lacibacter sp.]
MPQPETAIFYPPTPKAWRKWLEKNHVSQQAVWVVFYKKSSEKKSITWSEAVDEALCFGWIDSKKIRIDEETSHQFFSKRKAKSTWSKINKAKVEQLIESGAMTEAGLAIIETAKQNGSWSVLDDVEELVIPKDLTAAFKKYPGSKEYFSSLSKSIKKGMLQWLVFAKRPETREKRITEIASLAAKQQKPKPF